MSHQFSQLLEAFVLVRLRINLPTEHPLGVAIFPVRISIFEFKVLPKDGSQVVDFLQVQRSMKLS